MSKSDIAEQIYFFALERYQEEKPDIELTEKIREGIWFSICGELQRNGKESAWKYARTAKLLEM